MEFDLDPGVMAQTRSLVGVAAEALAQERRRVDQSVSALLTGGWTGPAASEYGQAWQEWCRGADEVLAALRRTAELLESTRTTYLSSDNASQASVQPVVSRLEQRLS